MNKESSFNHDFPVASKSHMFLPTKTFCRVTSFAAAHQFLKRLCLFGHRNLLWKMVFTTSKLFR